jgi:hypothetical protein
VQIVTCQNLFQDRSFSILSRPKSLAANNSASTLDFPYLRSDVEYKAALRYGLDHLLICRDRDLFASSYYLN